MARSSATRGWVGIQCLMTKWLMAGSAASSWRHGGFPGLAQGFALRAAKHAAAQEHNMGGRICRADGVDESDVPVGIAWRERLAVGSRIRIIVLAIIHEDNLGNPLRQIGARRCGVGIGFVPDLPGSSVNPAGDDTHAADGDIAIISRECAGRQGGETEGGVMRATIVPLVGAAVFIAGADGDRIAEKFHPEPVNRRRRCPGFFTGSQFNAAKMDCAGIRFTALEEHQMMTSGPETGERARAGPVFLPGFQRPCSSRPPSR